MKAIVIVGAEGERRFELQERADPVAVGTEILVDVRFAGINPADLLQRDGGYASPWGAPPDIPGLEVAGRVAAVGERVNGIVRGDRVFGLVSGGGLAEKVVVDSNAVLPVPDSLRDDEAAAIPETFITAHDAIRTQGGLAVGERLLVHGGTGGVGTAAIMIGHVTGARVFATVRTAEGRAYVEGLGAVAIEDADFVDQIRAATGGAGADVVLELVGAPHFPANVYAIAPRARIIVVGVGGGDEVNLPLGALMRARARVEGTVLRARDPVEKANAVRRFGKELLAYFAVGTLRPVIDQCYPVADHTAAFDRLAGSGKRGKLLVDFGRHRTAPSAGSNPRQLGA
jgi:NADPH:quinone reductase